MVVLNTLVYYLVIIPISLLPFPVLYAISDFLFFTFFYLIGYRKKVILQNIINSFPEKSKEEHHAIYKEFYKHFCDLIVESIKAFTISKEEVAKRVVCKNPEAIDKFFDQNRSAIIFGGHFNNWEIFAVGVDALVKHKSVGIYTPLSNLYFDEKMRSTRSRYGLTMISTKKIKRYLDGNKDQLTVTIFGGDQSPSNPRTAHWMNFLNQDTGVQMGAEKFAKAYNTPVVYGRINKEKRGHYSFEFFEITDSPNETAEGEITEKATRLLEKDIKEFPQYWLWSHRRWKHQNPKKNKK